jgi:HlyD family secretion protein
MNPNLKLYNTYIQIDNPDPALRNGMSCRVEIMVDKYDDALSVPIQAVTRVGGQPMVYAVEDGQVVAKPVELGLDNSRFVRIVSGLNGDESILLAPPFSEDKEEDKNKEKEKKDEKPREGGGGDKGSSNGGSRST